MLFPKRHTRLCAMNNSRRLEGAAIGIPIIAGCLRAPQISLNSAKQ